MGALALFEAPPGVGSLEQKNVVADKDRAQSRVEVALLHCRQAQRPDRFCACLFHPAPVLGVYALYEGARIPVQPLHVCAPGHGHVRSIQRRHQVPARTRK